jgi:hypothetical protein
MSVRIFTNPVTGKPWPTLTDGRPAQKNHNEQVGEKGHGQEEVVLINRWEKRRKRRKRKT